MDWGDPEKGFAVFYETRGQYYKIRVKAEVKTGIPWNLANWNRRTVWGWYTSAWQCLQSTHWCCRASACSG